jgi:hypothetical protein
VLILPSKAAGPGGSGSCFHNRHQDDLASDPAAALSRLCGGDGLERVVVDGLHEAVTEDIQRHAEGSNVFAAGGPLLRLCAGGPIIDQRTIRNHILTAIDRNIGVDEVPVAIKMTHPKLRDLTAAAGDRILVTVPARPRIVQGAQPAVDTFFLLKGRLHAAKRGIVHQTVALALAARIFLERRRFESGGRFIS